MDYGMYGSISQEIFNYLISIESQLRNVLCKKTMLYEDTFRIFLNKSLQRVEYLKTAPEQLISDLCFSMTPCFLDKGDILAKAGDKAKKLYIVFAGMIEIFTQMDNGTEFIIERLTSGSVINPTAFLIEDEIDTIFRAGSTAVIFELNVKQFVDETIKYHDFASRTAIRISD